MPQNVLAVNLANQHGSEGVLGKAFKEQAERFAKVKPGFEVVSFDFHKECGATRYDRRASLPLYSHPHLNHLSLSDWTHKPVNSAVLIPDASSLPMYALDETSRHSANPKGSVPGCTAPAL
jgi:hypothetical protein